VAAPRGRPPVAAPRLAETALSGHRCCGPERATIKQEADDLAPIPGKGIRL
jgi:hypothetical protein